MPESVPCDTLDLVDARYTFQFGGGQFHGKRVFMRFWVAAGTVHVWTECDGTVAEIIAPTPPAVGLVLNMEVAGMGLRAWLKKRGLREDVEVKVL